MNKRLFIAIDPPQEVREQLAALCYIGKSISPWD
jgi:2'-5' RNA ligase